jgi:signal transduction histidine kinase
MVLGALAAWAGAREGGEPVSMARALRLGIGAWAVWPLLSPFIVWLGQRWPLDQRTRRWKSLPIHVIAAALVGVVATGVTAAATYDWASGRPFGDVLRSRVALRAPMGSTVYVVILGVSYLAINTRRLREEELRATRLAGELNEAELAALRSQLQPHFLFNSLNAVMALLRDQDTARAERALTLVSDFLRRTLAEGREPLVPLARELAFVRNYVEIEKLRFGNRLHVVDSVPDELGRVQVPSFVLQPLVENALRHGLLGKPAGGSVRIDAERRDGTLRLSVVDDGVGLPRGWEPGAGSGVGVKNIRARLASMYGGAASLVIEPRADGAGTRAVVTLPLESAS